MNNRSPKKIKNAQKRLIEHFSKFKIIKDMKNFYDLNAIEKLLNDLTPKQIVKLLDNTLYFLVNYNEYEQLRDLSDYYHQLRLLRDSFDKVNPSDSETGI